jgi:hypothetical protein
MTRGVWGVGLPPPNAPLRVQEGHLVERQIYGHGPLLYDTGQLE